MLKHHIPDHFNQSNAENWIKVRQDSTFVDDIMAMMNTSTLSKKR